MSYLIDLDGDVGRSGSDDFQISAGNDIIKDFNPLDFLFCRSSIVHLTRHCEADVFIRYQNWKTVITLRRRRIKARLETFSYQFASNKQETSNYLSNSAGLIELKELL